MSSARDQSRKIKDFLEHWLERFRVSRTARESNPIEEGKYIETRTNEWGSKRESTIPRPRVRFRSFPPCHLGALLYDTRAIFWGRESRTDTARESSRGGLETFLSYENISPVGSISSYATYFLLYARFLVYRVTMHAVHLFFFFPRFVFVLPPHLSRIRGNHEHESTLLFVSRLGRNFLVKENEIRIDFFFLFFLFFLSNHVLAKKIDDRISRDGRFLRDINLSNLNLLSFFQQCVYIYIELTRLREAT